MTEGGGEYGLRFRLVFRVSGLLQDLLSVSSDIATARWVYSHPSPVYHQDCGLEILLVLILKQDVVEITQLLPDIPGMSTEHDHFELRTHVDKIHNSHRRVPHGPTSDGPQLMCAHLTGVHLMGYASRSYSS
jgi:hypothetical protein